MHRGGRANGRGNYHNSRDRVDYKKFKEEQRSAREEHIKNEIAIREELRARIVDIAPDKGVC